MPPRLPDYETFAVRAKEITRAIPAAYMEGVEDVIVHRGAKRHPLLPDIVTLGECEPSPLAAMAGHDPGQSIVHLYYGSFADLARRDPRFDPDEELKETIEHEIQHHVEDKAGVRALIDEDDLFDAHERFLAGLPVPAGWYRQGERMAEDVYAVEGDLFVELRLRRHEWEDLKGKVFTAEILGESFEAEIPEDAVPGEPLTYEGEGLLLDDGGEEGEGHGEREEGPGREEGEDEEGPAAGDLHLIPIVR